jgi:hypothetical protein
MRMLNLGKKLAMTLQALALVFSFGAVSVATVAVTAGPAYANQAACNSDPNAAGSDPLTSGASCAQANGTKDNLFAQGGIFQVVSNTLIFLVGAVAVIFLIIGGLRYVISQGDSKNIEAAKNTILYAIVGIVVAVISFALVQFVINALNKAS